MKTSTLQHLVDSLTGVRQHHLASALLESDPAHQSRELDQADKVGAVLDAVRFELAARDAPSGRMTDVARRAEHYLQRLLADFLEPGEREETPPTASPAALATAPGLHTGIAAGENGGSSVACHEEYADGIQQYQQAEGRIA
ncbi:MAG: hypothetical protein ACREP2_13835 [Rhodanobacteraceae bacterium]